MKGRRTKVAVKPDEGELDQNVVQINKSETVCRNFLVSFL